MSDSSRFSRPPAICAIFAFCLTLSGVAAAQTSELIQGRVVDSQSQAPVPFATVRFQGTTKGVISNAEGGFLLSPDYRLLADTIVITCIGYVHRSIPVSALKVGEVNTVELQTATTQLSEVTVYARPRISATRIVRRSLRNIPNNYPQSPFSYGAYYRDYQRYDSAYLNMNEALVEVFDPGFSTSHYDQAEVSLLRYRKNQDFLRDSTMTVAYDNQSQKFIPDATLSPFGGNELSILFIHDAIRNFERPSYAFVYTLRKDFLKNHRFAWHDILYRDRMPLFHIKFDARESATGLQYEVEGDLYVEPENYAIHKLDYAVYHNQNETSDRKRLYRIQVEYNRFDNRMYLNYISFNNFFMVRNPNDFEMMGIHSDQSGNILLLQFSQTPDSSALDKRNYAIRMGEQALAIDRVERYPRGIAIHLPAEHSLDVREAASQIKIDFGRMADTAGRILGKKTYRSGYQFRELFVQEVFPRGKKSPEAETVDKHLPLAKNRSTALPSDTLRYWMNSPLIHPVP